MTFYYDSVFLFFGAALRVVSYAAVICGEALRDDTNNGCVGDYFTRGLFLTSFMVIETKRILFSRIKNDK